MLHLPSMERERSSRERFLMVRADSYRLSNAAMGCVKAIFFIRTGLTHFTKDESGWVEAVRRLAGATEDLGLEGFIVICF